MLIHFFFQKLLLLVVLSMLLLPLSMRMSVNEEMRVVNGNRRQSTPFLDICHQNIPGNCTVEQIQVYVDLIIRRYRPAVLVVSEVSTEKMQNVVVDDYVWVQGKQKDFKTCRVSLFVQSCMPMEELEVVCEVPVVGVKMGEYNILGVYREWAHRGDQNTRSIPMQVSRSKTFVQELKKVKGKTLH